MPLIDAHGRTIDYLRLSVTDHCNLKCHYCMPAFSGRRLMDRADILTFEELESLARAAVDAGITKVRLTGGEPLIRRGITRFCRMLDRIEGLTPLSLTTNGVFLEEMSRDLYETGVRGINISLDTLQPKRFEMITGRNFMDRVWAGIMAAQRIGFDPIKINTVVMRGVNDDEVAALAALTYDYPFHVRFIELMPFQDSKSPISDNLFVPFHEMAAAIPELNPEGRETTHAAGGPAKLFTLPGARGKVGFITAMSCHFCGSCNRLRLTADGMIRTCLFNESEIDIKTPLRRGASQEMLAAIFRTAAAGKPDGHHLNASHVVDKKERGMYAIGG